MKQTLLPIGGQSHRSLDNFIEHGGSGRILESLTRYISGKGMHHVSSIYLSGEKGVGKSHLLEGAYYYCRDTSMDVMRFTAQNTAAVANENEFNKDKAQVLLFDDIDKLVDNDEWCAALMSWLDYSNSDKAHNDKANIRFVFAANAPPSRLKARRPDIVSRLSNSVVWTIEAPNEDDLVKIMKQHVHQLGFDLNDRSYQYMLERCPREISGLISILDQIGEESLVENRKPGFSLVSRIVRNRNFA